MLIIGNEQERIAVALEDQFGLYADNVLSGHHLKIDQESRTQLLFQIALAVKDAAINLHRNALGDYRPDPNADRFGGPFVQTQQKEGTAPGAKTVPFTALVTGWWKEGEAAGLFPEFVARSGNGHLFLTPNRNGDVLGPLQGVKNRLGEFAREVVTDPNVAPNHGWRHRFKTVGMEAGVSERVLDAICGHAPRTVGAAYGEVTLKARVNAIAKLPRYSTE